MGNLAIGTDGAGSVRIPCSFTGLFGLKPTQGRVPLYPPSAQGTLSHIGPMTRTVLDAAMMMNVIARPDPRDPYGRPDDAEDYLKGFDKGVKGLRIAYSPNLGFVEKEKIDRDVAVAVEAAAQGVQDAGRQGGRGLARPHGLDPRQILNAHWQSNVAMLFKGYSAEKQALMDPGLREGGRGRRQSRPGGGRHGDPPAPAARRDHERSSWRSTTCCSRRPCR